MQSTAPNGPNRNGPDPGTARRRCVAQTDWMRSISPSTCIWHGREKRSPRRQEKKQQQRRQLAAPTELVMNGAPAVTQRCAHDSAKRLVRRCEGGHDARQRTWDGHVARGLFRFTDMGNSVRTPMNPECISAARERAFGWKRERERQARRKVRR